MEVHTIRASSSRCHFSFFRSFHFLNIKPQVHVFIFVNFFLQVSKQYIHVTEQSQIAGVQTRSVYPTCNLKHSWLMCSPCSLWHPGKILKFTGHLLISQIVLVRLRWWINFKILTDKGVNGVPFTHTGYWDLVAFQGHRRPVVAQESTHLHILTLSAEHVASKRQKKLAQLQEWVFHSSHPNLGLQILS